MVEVNADSDPLADISEPRCPACGTMFDTHARGRWCRDCAVQWPEGLSQYGDRALGEL